MADEKNETGIFEHDRDAGRDSYDSSVIDHHGTYQDVQDMLRLGRKQRFKRNFHFVSMLGFVGNLTVTWEAFLATASGPLINGGLAGFVWVTLGVIFFQTIYVTILAQLGSMAPTPGGQYHWVSEFAPRKYQKITSYTVGWLCCLGWQGGAASTAYLTATLTQGLAILNYPDYVPTRWQGTLLTFLAALFSLGMNTFGAKKLPLLEIVVLVLHIGGFFAFFITLFVMPNKLPAKAVFTEFTNTGGWPNTGTACLVAMIGPLFSTAGADCAVHIAEEVKDASKTVPRAMFWSVLVNSSMGWLIVVATCFHVRDLQGSINSTTGYPIIEILYHATGSKTATNILMGIVIVLIMFGSSTNVLATVSRQIFAFARDNGLPFSRTFSKVTHIFGAEIPLNALFLSLSITILLALVNIGSVTAFSSIVGLTAASLHTAYAISILVFVTYQVVEHRELPPSRFHVPFALSIGLALVAFGFLVLATIMSFWPNYSVGLSTANMNWGILVYGVVIGFALVAYFVRGRKKYEGPVVYVRQVAELRRLQEEQRQRGGARVVDVVNKAE